jgi:predicted DNA-binding transcriptional regulator YafY
MFDITSTFQRYLEMLKSIPHHPDYITANQLLEKLEKKGFTTNIRTVQRDLLMLKKVFEISSGDEEKSEKSEESKQPKRWHYKPNSLPFMAPSLDDHTALSFIFVQKFLISMMPPDSIRTLDPWFRAASQRLSARRGNTAKWQEKVHILTTGLPRLSPSINPKVQSIVYQAILNEWPLRIKYRARGANENKEHLISPLGLVVKGGIIYLVATHNVKGDALQFALHRTQDAEPDKKADYIKPLKKWINLHSYAEEKFGFPMGEPETLTLKLHLTGHAVISVTDCPISKKQSVVKSDDGSLLTAEVPNTLELRQWIRSLGLDATIIEPISLRREFKQELELLSKRYE